MTTGMNTNGRIVITGIGVFSPLGIGVEEVWKNLLAGKSGVRKVVHVPGVGTPDEIGGEIAEFTEDAAKKSWLKELRRSLKAMCREVQFGVAGALQAVNHAGIDLNSIDHDRLGIDFGANLMLSPPDILNDAVVACSPKGEFDPSLWGEFGFPKMEPLWLLRYLPNMPACHIGITLDARGPSNSLTLEDSSGNTAISEASRIIDRGAADIMITGTTGTLLHPIRSMHQALLKDLAATPADPARRCRPFDKDRSGRVLAEAACTLILERADHAEKRGAKIWGEVLGFGAAFAEAKQGYALGNYRQSIAAAIKNALQSAKVKPQDIGHINANGLGTVDMDADEAFAIHDVFGEYASRVPVTAIKSLMGTAGAGSGLLEITSSLLGLSQGLVPYTINYDTPDPALPPLNIVTREPVAISNKTFLNVNVTRVGQATAVVIRSA